MVFVKIKSWSIKNNKCVKCGTNKKYGKYQHMSKGFCRMCWIKNRNGELRLKIPNYNSKRKYFLKNKDSPEFKKRNIPVQRRAWLVKKFKKSILGQYKIKKKLGIKYFCDDCDKYIITPINEKLERGKQITQLNVFKKWHIKLIHKEL